MEHLYDYSRHKSCISFTFDYDSITSQRLFNDNHFDSENDTREVKTTIPSILFDTTTKTIIARGDLADQAIRETEKLQSQFFYVRNTFSELSNIYSRSQHETYKYGAYDNIALQEAAYMLQQHVDHWKEKSGCLNMDFFYAFTLPINWDYEIREALIRPLFIMADLIYESDDQRRIVFFTELESTFRFMQLRIFPNSEIEIQHGTQYIICTLDFQNGMHVKLDLVSAQYPSLKAADSDYVPQILNQAQFTIPSILDGISLLLDPYLKKHYNIILPPEVIDILSQKVRLLQGEIETMETILYQDEILDLWYFQYFLSYHPFQELPILYHREYNLKKTEIDAIQSITLDDIFGSLPDSTKKEFLNQMDILLQGMGCAKARSMIIFYSDRVKENRHCQVLLKSIVKWSKIYNEGRRSCYKLITNGNTSSFNLSTYLTQDEVAGLVEKRMKEFTMFRDPVIISTKLKTTQSVISSRPICFINMDIQPTQIKTTLTYINEEGQVQLMEDIECDIPALDGFITQTEIHQKPILHITDGMIMQLQKIFKDSLKMHSKYGKHDKREGSLNDHLRMETSKNNLKEIRDLLTLSKSNLLEQLMENIKLDTFFTMDDKSCNTDNLVTTCQPEHMFFFMLIYFYNLGKQLEDKIGNKWRHKSIWYGVCIDKNLLDTMFGSTKKLEKLFFASGILQKDNNFIKAKFCVRGEEILPAIQQKFEDLDFKMKSYFVVAQIFEKHVQLTMHQIVKLASSGSDSASIVIQDKIIYINDVYDTLFKKIWMGMQHNHQIDFCTTHMQNKNTQNNFGSIQKCGYIRQNLKSCVAKLLNRNRDKLDMNSTIKINIDDKCDCNINIFLCNVIEVGLKSVMEDIAAVIAASLSNKEIFGNYETDYLFMLGDPFNLSHGSLIYNAYTIVAQQAIDDSIELNQRDTQGFILRESLRRLLKPNTHNKPYMYDRFITGTLCQVSSKTHAVRFSSLYGGDFYSFFLTNKSNDVKKIIRNDGSYLVFIKKGQHISKMGLAIKIEEIPRDQPLAEIISVKSSKGIQSEKYNLLDKHTTGVRHEIHTGRQKRSTHKFKVEYRRLQYNCSYELSARVMGYDVDYNETLYEEFVNMIEPLTLKYI